MTVMLLFVLLLVLAAPVGAQENSLPRDVPAASYQILSIGFFGKTSTLQKKLAEASSHGYHVVGSLERVLLVHRAPTDERRLYTTVGNGEIESLEQQMNAAAASGFRVVPDAVLISFPLAVMEKRVGTAARGADYRLLSFTTDYEIHGTAPRLAVSGGFETDVIDQRLAEMAVAGYRLVALVTRTLDERTIRKPVVGGLLGKALGKKLLTVEIPKVRQELIMFFEKERDAPAVTHIRDAARRYHAVMAGTETELEGQLNRAAAAGYRLVTIASNAYPETIAIVEKQALAAAPPAYRVLVPSTIDSMTDDLSQAAATGWLPHARGVLDPSGGRLDMPRVLFVLERQQPATPGTLVVLEAMRSSTLARELNQATADGFELLAVGASHGLKVLVLQALGLPASLARVPAVERRAGAGRAEKQPAAISEGHISPVALP